MRFLYFQNLFTDFIITQVEEMSLGANQLKSEVNRLKWKAEGDQINEDTLPIKKTTDNAFEVHLSPMQIKTFLITIERYV